MSTGRTTIPLNNGHLLPMLGMTANRRINSALQCWEPSTHERRITPLQLPGL
jgi:hypothetical protein